MSKLIAKRFLSFALIAVIAFGSVVTVSMVSAPTVYAASKTSTSKQVKSYRKSIKSYRDKTYTLYKRTPAAKKYYTAAKSAYSKSLKTKKIKTLKSYKAKANEAYKSARIVDYRRQIKEKYDYIAGVHKSYPLEPTIKDCYTTAKSLYDKSKKTGNISTLNDQHESMKQSYTSSKNFKQWISSFEKTYTDMTALCKDVRNSEMVDRLAEEKSRIERLRKEWLLSTKTKIERDAQTASYNWMKTKKDTLVWYPAEYRTETVPGYYKTVVVQEAEYQYREVSYFVWVAQAAGYETGNGLSYEQRIAQGKVFPYYSDDAMMREWGCIWYADENDDVYKLYPNLDDYSAYKAYLMSVGIETQTRGTVELFLIKPEVTERQWVPETTKQVLVRAAGWY